MLEITSVVFLKRIKALPVRIQKDSTRVRSARAHSQQSTFAAGKYE